MLIQAQQQPVSFAPSCEGSQHAWPSGRSFQLRSASGAFSGWSSPRGHSMRQCWCGVPVVHASTFLCSLRSTPVTEFQRYYGHSDSYFQKSLEGLSTMLQRYYGHSDSCPAGSSRHLPMSLVCDAPRQVSLIHAQCHHDHSVSKHPTWRSHRFDTLPLSATACRTRRSRLRHWLAGSPHTPGRIEFVILRTDRSPPAAPHPASRRRSCSRLQAGERMPEEDFHLSDSARFQAH